MLDRDVLSGNAIQTARPVTVSFDLIPPPERVMGRECLRPFVVCAHIDGDSDLVAPVSGLSHGTITHFKLLVKFDDKNELGSVYGPFRGIIRQKKAPEGVLIYFGVYGVDRWLPGKFNLGLASTTMWKSQNDTGHKSLPLVLVRMLRFFLQLSTGSGVYISRRTSSKRVRPPYVIQQAMISSSSAMIN